MERSKGSISDAVMAFLATREQGAVLPEIYAAVERRTSPRDGLESSHGHPPLRRRRRLHRHPARRATSSRSSRTRGRSPRSSSSRSRARSTSRRRSSSTSPRARATRASGSSRRRPSSTSRAIRCSGRRSCSAGRSSSRRSASRRAPASFPIVLDRDDQGRIVFGRMSQPIPKIEEFDRRTSS